MYLKYYELEREPFDITPDPHFLYLSPSHREAFAAMVYGVVQRKGFIAVVGQAGTGKTILLRAFLDRLDPDRTKAIYIANPLVSFDQILNELTHDTGSGTLYERLRRLQRSLIDDYAKGRNVVIVIDEAQRMSPGVLEHLRLLSNLETSEDKLIQIVLAGQPEFYHRLEQHALQQLEQRIVVRARLEPLSTSESISYVDHRLSKARRSGHEIFTKRAIQRIAHHARGNPRVLNALCDSALIAGYSYQQKPVNVRLVSEVIADYSGVRKRSILAWTRAAAIAGVLCGGGFFMHQAVYGDADTVERSGTAGTFGPVGLSTNADSVAPMERVEGPFPPVAITPYESLILASVPAALKKDAGPSPTDGPTRERSPETEGVSQGVTMIVRRGDSLWSLCRAFYGFVNADVVETVLRANAHLGDPDNLSEGEELLFPPISSGVRDIASAPPSTAG